MIKKIKPVSVWRYRFVMLAFIAMALAAFARLVYLQVMDKAFLQSQGDMRTVRTVEMEALRGIILDRHNEPLAVSAPVDSLWVNPSDAMQATEEQLQTLAHALNMPYKELTKRIKQAGSKEFVYLKRQIEPSQAEAILALKIPGVNLQREYRRYYPAGEAAAHIVGLVDIDDAGVEGLELIYNHHLTGTKGKKRVLKDRRGRIIQDLELIRNSEPGQPLVLSLDNRLQYLAYRELKSAVTQNQAKGGSLILLDVQTGEVLAMVNQPSYNPNNRNHLKPANMRNRAVTDVFEPGSVIKAFSLLAALESGKYTPQTRVNTSPGTLTINGNTIHDIRNFGELDLHTVLRKSSNVGTAKVVLSLPQKDLLSLYQRLGFGRLTNIEFPGEREGQLDVYRDYDPFSYATLTFGYGLSSTAMQLAKAYAIIASGGMDVPVTLLKRDALPEKTQVVQPKAAEALKNMLVIHPNDGGSGAKAMVRGYNVAGKTGTTRKLGESGYVDNAHIASFIGFAPASSPRLVCVVIIDEPKAGEYYGGAVAAPVFSEVMRGALRLMDIPLDDKSAYHTVAKH